MNLNDFLNEVSRHVDTEKSQINAADTRRVISEAFKVLAQLDAATAAEVIAKGLGNAKKKLK